MSNEKVRDLAIGPFTNLVLAYSLNPFSCGLRLIIKSEKKDNVTSASKSTPECCVVVLTYSKSLQWIYFSLPAGLN